VVSCSSRGVDTSALQPSHSPDSPLRDFVPTIGLQGTYSQLVLDGFRPSKRCRHFCATPVPQDIWVWASSVQSIIVRAVNPDHSEGLQYHVLPDDPLRALNILREAAGLPPFSDEHDDQGG
jgi:hypothetical protein